MEFRSFNIPVTEVAEYFLSKVNFEYGDDAPTKSAITNALKSMQDKNKLSAKGETKNKIFTVL